jgi:EmrB/QacA subfamily drug resistance transporter
MRIGKNPWAALLTMCLGFFIVMLDGTLLIIAAPAILGSLRASLDQGLWIFNADVLVIAVLFITGGRLGDLFGPRAVFLCGLAVFMIASAFCGIAQNPGELIAARIIEGLGAALLTPQALPVVAAIFPAERLGVAFGVYGSVAGIAAIAGPTIGGLIVESFGWRWIFLLNVPVCLLTIALTLVSVPVIRPRSRPRFDVRGVLLASAALLAVSYGLIEGQRYGWGRVWSVVSIPVLIIGGVVTLCVFLWTQRGPWALVPPTLLADRGYTLMSLMAAAAQFALLGTYLPLTIYLQSVLGMNALAAGLTLVGAPIATAVVAPLAGHFSNRMARPLLVTGVSLFAAGVSFVALSAGPATSGWALQPGLITIGVGSSLIWAPMTTVALRNVPFGMIGAASGVLNTARQLGTIMASAAVGAVLQNRLAVALTGAAIQRSGQLPAPLRGPFLAAFGAAARAGINVGTAQHGAKITLPPGLGPAVAGEIRRVASQVFAGAFVSALRPALLLSVVVLAAAAGCAVAVPAQERIASGHDVDHTTRDRALSAGTVQGKGAERDAN